ncbi:MAG: dephospho-CoA kinase [Velocimicrobium sp.]
MNTCKVIGLTGGIGAGKTFVAAYAHEKFGIPILLADEVGHIALEPGCETYEKIVDTFGSKILASNGIIDRKQLSNLVFSNQLQLEKLNAIVHPFIETYIREKITYLKKETQATHILLEAAILLESNLVSLCDEIWLVMAQKELREERLKNTRGYTDKKIEEIMKVQLTEKAFMERVDKIIINNGNLKDIDRQLEVLLVK